MFKFILKEKVQRFILGVIIFNSITLGLQTSNRLVNSIGDILNYLDYLAVAIFTVEIICKIVALRLKFFKDYFVLSLDIHFH